ncbi:MAG: PKD domain-containing protein [Candidatus Daviesbacteria bacterium]|nr:PKD domain-containing protein [Candidatus Daviesbacteria bacterium]
MAEESNSRKKSLAGMVILFAGVSFALGYFLFKKEDKILPLQTDCRDGTAGPGGITCCVELISIDRNLVTVNVTVQGGVPPYSVLKIDWGDGITEWNQGAPGRFTHIYAQRGAYRIDLSTMDSTPGGWFGQSCTGTVNAVVN